MLAETVPQIVELRPQLQCALIFTRRLVRRAGFGVGLAQLGVQVGELPRHHPGKMTAVHVRLGCAGEAHFGLVAPSQVGEHEAAMDQAST